MEDVWFFLFLFKGVIFFSGSVFLFVCFSFRADNEAQSRPKGDSLEIWWNLISFITNQQKIL